MAIDPTTNLGKVRLKIGDWQDLPMLPDAVITQTLADNSDNVNKASQTCAQYILGMLTSKTHSRLAQLESWRGEQFTNYVKFLQLTILNPHLNTVAPIPYTGSGTETTPIQDFIEDWKDGYLSGSEVIPAQAAGRVIENAPT